MSPKERRAYRLGYLHAMRRARKDLHAMAQHWDDEIAGLTDILQDTVNEFHRLRDVEHAIAICLSSARASMRASGAQQAE